MRHHSSLLACIAALTLSACSSPPENVFASDRIDVVTRGTGPDIVLVPGLAAHRDIWGSVADSLDDDHTLHLVQVNGFAGLPPGANADGPVLAPVAAEIARYISETGLERPAIVGHSLGGTIVLMLAARHPDAAGRVMVVDGMPFLGVAFGPPGTTAESIRPTADSVRARILADPPGEPTGMLESMFARMTRVDAMRPVLLRYLRDSDRAVVANAFHEAIVTDLRPELARIAVPVTALWVFSPNAELSREEFERSVRASFADVRRLQVIEVEESNHFVQLDQPARLVAEIEAFMRRR